MADSTNTKQERADFEAWAVTEKFVIDFDAEINQYDVTATRLAFSAWQAARRTQEGLVPQDAPTHNKSLNSFIALANQIDFARPRSASLTRKFILETRDAILDLFKENQKLHRKIDVLTAAPQPPEAAQ